MQEHRQALLNSLLKVIEISPADVGKEFELNLEDEKGPMVVVTKDPIEHKYPVVRPLSDL
jgi:hypothetical protein